MKRRALSLTLVAIQIAAALYIAVSGPIFRLHPAAFALAAAGAALGAWAVFTMKLRHLRILPEPGERTRLVETGPYRFIRHPMYTSLLLVVLALTAQHPTPLRLAAWLLLLADLLVKLHVEERWLRERFPGYADYCRRTRRLAPFLY